MKRTPLLILGVGALLAFLPRLGLPAFYDSLLYLMLHWVVLATSWNILSGYTGYFSFGHGAFFGAGLYTTSTLLARYEGPFLWTLPVAALASIAGVCLALSFTLAPAQIYAWIGVVFAAVMLGGLGRALGPLIAGTIIGVSEAITMAVTAPSWAPIVSFTLLIVILVLRPGRAT